VGWGLGVVVVVGCWVLGGGGCVGGGGFFWVIVGVGGLGFCCGVRNGGFLGNSKGFPQTKASFTPTSLPPVCGPTWVKG